MASIPNHIAALRLLIKKYDDDSIYTDQALYSFLIKSTAFINKKEEERNNTKQSEWLKNKYCIALEAGNSHSCECIPVGCTVLKSKSKIPKPLSTSKQTLFKVFTLDNEEIGKVKVNYKTTMLDPLMACMNSLSYDVCDGYLLIWGGNVEAVIPRVIQVTGLFEDPTEWAKIEACNTTDGTPTGTLCYNIANDEFPLEEHLTIEVYETVLKIMGYSLKIPNLNRPDLNQNYPN